MQNRQLVVLSTSDLRMKAIPCGAATTNAVSYRVFRYNTEQMNNFPLYVQLPFERYSSRHIYYQRSVVSRFPFEYMTDDKFAYPGMASVRTILLAAYLLPT
jgi:hypothetical protein